MELEISRKEFRYFLATNPLMVFRAVAACHCPVAGFLNRDISEMFDSWSVTQAYSRRRGAEWTNPEWVAKFVKGVDFSRPANQNITGAEALQILDSLES